MALFMWTKCPVCTEGRAKETRYRIQETNRRIFCWIQNGEEEEREEDSPYVFFCEDCEEDLDNWGGQPDGRQPTEAATEQQNGKKEEPEPKRSRRNEAGGGDAEEPEPKRSRRNDAAPQGSDREDEIQPGPSNTHTEE
jgi:hypothetical protein